jgi:hypothetical protein
MAGFQNFTPRTANLAKVWEGFNPAANFLGGAKAVQQMDLDAAAEARLRELADTDRMVKETMLPYETELAQAKIGLILAQKDYAASRASRAADDASALSVFERAPNDRSEILRILGLDDEADISPAIRSGGGGGASILDAAPPSGGDFESFSLGASASPTNNPIVAEFSPKEEEETGPLYNLPENKTLLADSSDSFGVPDTGGQDNLKSLTAASALTPKEEGPTMRNAADWDEDQTNFSPLEKKNPLTSLEIPEDKRKEIERLNDETGALNKNQDQAAPTSEEDMGAYLVKGLNQLEKAKDRAQLAQSGPEKRFVSGIAAKLEDLTYREAAKKLGIDPSMGEYAVKALTRSGVNGVRRSPSQINQIVDLVKGGMDITEASTFFDAKARNELQNKLNGKTAGDDTIKVVNEINTALKPFLDEEGNPLSGKEAYVDRLYADLDSAMGTPTGTGKYGYQNNLIANKINKVERAGITGVLSEEDLAKERQDLNQKQIALANDNAPYFKTREELAKWLSDETTRNLPYFTEISGKKVLAKSISDDPNSFAIWTPTEKSWVNAAAAKPKEKEAQAETTSPNTSGKKLRSTAAPLLKKAINFAKDPVSTDLILNSADYVATGIRNNVTAPAVEWVAGVAGKELDMGRTTNPSITERNKKPLTGEEMRNILLRTQNPLINLLSTK